MFNFGESEVNAKYSMTLRDQVIRHIERNGKFLIQSFRSSDLLPFLKKETEACKPKNIAHMVHIVINGVPPKCEYGNYLQFNTFQLGYRKGCVLGNKCKCVSKFRKQNQKETLKRKYGVETTGQVPGSLEKRKATMHRRYGVDFAAQSTALQDKRIASLKNRSSDQKNEQQEKRKATSNAKYGFDHHMQSVEQQSKVKNTNMGKYGHEYPLQNSEIAQKMKSTLSKRSDSEKQEIEVRKQTTLIDRYGVHQPSQVGKNREVLKLLETPDQLSEFVKGKTRREVSAELGIHAHTLYLKVKEYGISDEFVAPSVSQFESDVMQFVKSLDINDVKRNVRSIIAPSELDIFIPEKNIAIECSGLYWHSEKSAGRLENYHHSKFERCKKSGINLITIFDDDWILKQDIVKSRLQHALGKTPISHSSIDCVIKEVSNDESNRFLEQNHIQGTAEASVKIGLYKNDELFSLMTFNTSRLQHYDWELIRFCEKVNTSVIDGANELIHFFRKNHSGSVISYSDNCWGVDNLDEKLGFIFLSESIGYSYTNYKERFPRNQFQKHEIQDLVEDGANKTEWQIMQELKFDRVWNCGQSTWVLNDA